ncbi:MAG: hypothetical protein OXC91_04245 [Rhodobacteraceae bacterium]|nr:hypothetical protein [Paracoccaceae bacterium]
MADDRPKEKSKWEQTLETYQKLKEEGRLDEIEPVPEELNERIVRMTRPVVRKDRL